MEDLFQDSSKNLLPIDGEVFYQPNFLDISKATDLFHHLLKSPLWQSDRIKLFGKEIVTGRKVIWFGEPDCSYQYSGVKKTPVEWDKAVRSLKQKIEQEKGGRFNSCLANLYHHGDEAMGWHSDNEVELGKKPHISVVSIGAARKFKLKHKLTNEVVDIYLEPGSLLQMKETTQMHWKRTLRRSKRVKEARISLTYREIQSL